MSKAAGNVIKEYHLNKNQPDQPQFAIYDLNGYVKISQAEATKPHIHSYYQIIWFKKGTGKHFVDFQTYDVFDNALFFIAKNQVHYFDNHTDCQGILIHFNEAFLVKNESDTESFLKYNLFNNPYMQSPCCIDTDIDENYKKGFTIAEYARLLFMSSRSLTDLTSHQINKTPSQMIQERIILEAQRLLLYSNLNINQIGYRLGFDDPSYFVKYFRKHTNTSPSEFRKSVS